MSTTQASLESVPVTAAFSGVFGSIGRRPSMWKYSSLYFARSFFQSPSDLTSRRKAS